MEVYELSATELRAMIHNKTISVKELTEAFFHHIHVSEDSIHAFVATNEQQAMDKAEQIDALLAAGKPAGFFAGVPYGLKDNICTKNFPTTCASKALQNHHPAYNASVTEFLEDEGAILVGKLNMDELAMGSSCEQSFFGPTKNPWDLKRVPGGSSGGSAAAVAACEVPFALGTDTGGSIRLPAAFCGIVGLKPTYGRVSRNGLIAAAPSLDQIGPMTRTVEDAYEVFRVISKDAAKVDATYCGASPDGVLNSQIRGLKIGVPQEYLGPWVSQDIRERVLEALKVLQKKGARLVDISLDAVFEYALPAYYCISTAEISSSLARFDGIRFGCAYPPYDTLDEMYIANRSECFGEEAKRRILMGTFVLSRGQGESYYLRARHARHLVTRELEGVFNECDAIITPTTPFTAFEFGEKKDNPAQMQLSDICTVPANLAGLPALSVPCGLDRNKLPVGMQIIGPRYSENLLFNIARCYEKAVGGFPQKELVL